MYREKIQSLLQKAQSSGDDKKKKKNKKSSPIIPIVICAVVLFAAKEHFQKTANSTTQLMIYGQQENNAPISDLVTTLELPIFKSDFSQQASADANTISNDIFAKKEITKKERNQLPKPIAPPPKPVIEEPEVNYQKLVDEQLAINALMSNGAVINGRFYAIGDQIAQPVFSNQGKHTMVIERIAEQHALLLVDGSSTVELKL